jgi:DNA gyrase subunit B
MEEFLALEAQKRGVVFRQPEELKAAAAAAIETTTATQTAEKPLEQKIPEVIIEVTDLHEMRTINDTLKQLKGWGVSPIDLVPAPSRQGEAIFPFLIEHDGAPTKMNSMRELPHALRKLGEKGMSITRFKGLGEMDKDELWSTSMDPEARSLIQVTMNDAAAAEEMFRVLMGDHVEPRREFIEKHALEVKELDV